MVQGVDYTESFSPVTTDTTIWTAIAMAVYLQNEEWLNNVAYFTHLVPVDSVTVGIKAISSVTHSNVLGLITQKDSIQVTLFDSIFENHEDKLILSTASLNNFAITTY